MKIYLDNCCALIQREPFDYTKWRQDLDEDLTIEEISRKAMAHRKKLNRYLQKQATQDIRRRISRVFIATTAKKPQIIIGYYTLSTLSIELSQLPEQLSRKLPKHALPAALIGRLAVDRSAQGHGVGKMLPADAVKRTLSVSDQIAIYAMVVDAIDEKAAAFYEKFGFVRLGADLSRLFLPLKSI